MAPDAFWDVRDVGFRPIANGRTACSGRLDKTWWDMPRCKFLIFHDGHEKPFELNLPLRVIETESGYSLEYSSKQNNLADDEWGWDCANQKEEKGLSVELILGK